MGPLDTSLVVPIHTAVPGRARLKVARLRGSQPLCATLEQALVGHSGIRRVSANTWTGNILVHFDPAVEVGQICTVVARALRDLQGCVRPGDAADAKAYQLPAARLNAPRQAPEPARAAAWHQLEGAQVVADLRSSAGRGLSTQEVRQRRERYGSNALPEPEGRSQLGMIAEQFTTLPVALLGASAALSVATGGVFDALAIMGVVLINAGIGYVTESQAEATIASLKTLVRPIARVVRDGEEQEVSAVDVVPGDLLSLGPGSFVAADARVIGAQELTVDEAALTGESVGVQKNEAPLPRADLPLGSRLNMVYNGTAVISGEGRAVVIGTGAETEIGRIQALVRTAERPETPMERQLDRVGTQLVWLCSAVCGFVFALGLWRGYGPLPMLKTAVALAVAAVPEGLPALATSTLALGVRKMRHHNVQIRHLAAVETLGSVEVLCFDKTGTLTRNEMAVVDIACGRHRYAVENGHFRRNGHRVDLARSPDLRRLMELGALCNETEVASHKGSYALNGSPTESALIRLALAGGIHVQRLRARHPRLTIRHRTQRRQYVSTLHDNGGGPRLIAVKGNPTAVLGLCRNVLRGTRVQRLSEADRERITAVNAQMAGETLRVLGFAFAEAPDERAALARGLTWVGLAGLADPIRGGMQQLMAALHRAGIRTVMITGDQSATAYAIARRLDLSGGRDIEILDSEHLERLDPDMLRALAQRAQVFARVSPAHKLQIVRALQRAGKVVAMTGDGINDSPALKAADIGIAMGRGGTDLARDVADVILADDDLRTMEAAVSQGRTIYGNIRKSIHYLLATNLSEIVVTLGATASGVGQPLSPVQLLWINLISDVLPAVGLALEPPEPDVLQRPPRDPQEAILQRQDFRRIGQEATLISAGALAAYGYGVLRYGPGPRTSTLTFASLIAGQLLHAVTSRSETHGLLTREKLPSNPYLEGSLAISFAAQVAALLFPKLRQLLGIVPVSPVDSLVALAGGTLPFLVNEAIKIGREPPAGSMVAREEPADSQAQAPRGRHEG